MKGCGLFVYEPGMSFLKDITYHEKLSHHCFNFKGVFQSVNLDLYITNVPSKLLKSDCKYSLHKYSKNNIWRLVLEDFVLF